METRKTGTVCIGTEEAQIIDRCLNNGYDVQIRKTPTGIKIVAISGKVVFRT